VPPAEFEAWVKRAKQEFARVDGPETPVEVTVKVAEHALSK
jgi:hypothetical protein